MKTAAQPLPAPAQALPVVPTAPLLPSSRPSADPSRRGPAVRSAAWLMMVGAATTVAGCGGDSSSSGERGALTTRADVVTLSRAEIDAATTAAGAIAISGAARCDVRLQRIVYRTIGARGEGAGDVTASAGLLIPSGPDCPGPYRLVAYDHGTSALKAYSMADPATAETQFIAAFFAAQGYVVVAPDYLGYADSNYDFHPYLHALSEATVTLDALRAARQALADDRLAVASGVLLTGYSQGGHASMATQRLIEADPASGFTVAAAGHMSGPYDLAGTFRIAASLLPSGTGGSSVFVPFALTSYQKVYGGLYTSPTYYFREPWAATVESLLPGPLSTSDLILQGRLPLLLGDIMTDQFVTDATSEGSALSLRLLENNLLDWTPKAPTLLCGGARDPVVPLANAVAARTAFAARGATVTVVDVEQVAAFSPLFPETLSAAQLGAYHAQTVPPLCMAVVRDQLFAPSGAAAVQP